MANNYGGNSSSSSKGVGFSGLLTIVFIVLKLCGVINWSWVWVLAPLWIMLILIVVTVVLIGFALSDRKGARRK